MHHLKTVRILFAYNMLLHLLAYNVYYYIYICLGLPHLFFQISRLSTIYVYQFSNIKYISLLCFMLFFFLISCFMKINCRYFLNYSQGFLAFVHFLFHVKTNGSVTTSNYLAKNNSNSLNQLQVGKHWVTFQERLNEVETLTMLLRTRVAVYHVKFASGNNKQIDRSDISTP